MNHAISDAGAGQVPASADEASRRIAPRSIALALHSLIRKAARACSLVVPSKQNQALGMAMQDAGLPGVSYYTWRTRYRHLRMGYLRGAFSVREAILIATTHHRMLARHARPDFLATASSAGFPCWRHQAEDGRCYSIHLRYPYSYNFDGDLSFCMDCDGADIYIVSVTFAPGQLLGLPGRTAILVSGIQGINGKIENIRAATESCNNVAPPHMLLAAVEAFAMQCGVVDMIGLDSRRKQDKKGAEFDYSGFWQPLSGQEQETGLHHIPLPFTDKPLEAIQAKHRSRARKRRELRNIIRQQIIAGTGLAMAEGILRNRMSPPAVAPAQDASQGLLVADASV